MASEMQEAINEYLSSLHVTIWGQSFTIAESQKRRQQCISFIEKLVREINTRMADRLVESNSMVWGAEPAALDPEAQRRSEAALASFATDPSNQRNKNLK